MLFVASLLGYLLPVSVTLDLPQRLSSKNLLATQEQKLIPGLRRSLRGGNSNLFQYSCLEKPKDRRTWWVTVHRVTKNWLHLSTHTCMSRSFYIVMTCAFAVVKLTLSLCSLWSLTLHFKSHFKEKFLESFG